MNPDSPIYVAGSETLLGASLLRVLKRRGFKEAAGEPDSSVDLTDFDQVQAVFDELRPEYVFLAAGKTGGIEANRRFPADLMLDNLRVTANILECAHRSGVERALYFASACTYPRLCAQPMKEDQLLTGPFEPTNAAYATAKLAGIELCHAYRQQHGNTFIAAIPTNAYGPEDDFSPENGHVVSGLIRRIHEATVAESPYLTAWGTGAPRREFLYVDDVAEAAVHAIEHYGEPEPINLAGGESRTIAELAQAIKEVIAYPGEIRFDTTKPDGMPEKVLDNSKLKGLGWEPTTPLADGLRMTYKWFLAHCAEAG